MANASSTVSTNSQKNMFGLELLLKTVENAIRGNEDDTVVLFHWVLIKEGFRCIGLGDAKEVSGDEEQTELLPENWNAIATCTYLLRYVKDGKLFLARISKSGDGLLINLIRSEDMKIVSMIVASSKIREGGCTDREELVKNMEKDLVQPFIPIAEKPKTDTVTFTDDRKTRLVEWIKNERRLPPTGYGRSDLDPFPYEFGGPSGMIYPMPGSIPSPGVRFDPIHPGPGPGQASWGRPRGRPPSGPDPDHFLPPGGGGGYFM